MSNTSTWNLELVEDPDTGDLMIELPNELLSVTGWKVGTTLKWIDNNDGSWSLQTSK